MDVIPEGLCGGEPELGACGPFEDPLCMRYIRGGSMTLRSRDKVYHPCVKHQTGWENFFHTWPRDYNVKCEKFDARRSTYHRLMDLGFPIPESETIDSLKTGYYGYEGCCVNRPAKIHGWDQLPEPNNRPHLSDNIAKGLSKADPVDPVMPWGEPGDMCGAKSVTKRDFKWRAEWKKQPEKKRPPYERKMWRKFKTDIHGRQDMNCVVKFEDDYPECFLNSEIGQLRFMYEWPESCITGLPIGGVLCVDTLHPCIRERRAVWPCPNERDFGDSYCLPRDRCKMFGVESNIKKKQYLQHCHQRSVLDAHPCCPSRTKPCIR